MVEAENNARRIGPALEAMYQFILWLVPTVDKRAVGWDPLEGPTIYAPRKCVVVVARKQSQCRGKLRRPRCRTA